ncbi:hypothetical protein Mapa_013249 [Marchantia paleacea]|nr:hypothetical protein Mapa_013249 [Marchantia paleacea]
MPEKLNHTPFPRAESSRVQCLRNALLSTLVCVWRKAYDSTTSSPSRRFYDSCHKRKAAVEPAPRDLPRRHSAPTARVVGTIRNSCGMGQWREIERQPLFYNVDLRGCDSSIEPL